MVCNDGDIIPLFIIPHGLTLNTECLEEVVMLWIKKGAAGRPYIW